jgi:hypothetical protein
MHALKSRRCVAVFGFAQPLTSVAWSPTEAFHLIAARWTLFSEYTAECSAPHSSAAVV